MNFKALATLYKKELLQNVIPFWMKHSVDHEKGGFFSCLLRDGQVFDKDKFIWLQARQVWTFAALFNQLEAKQEWLDMALHGANFLEKHGRDEAANWYFSLNQEGQPLIQAYNIFSDCFATMAFGQLYKATQKEAYADIALTTFRNILERQNNPKGIYTKAYPGTRPLSNFSLPMILSNLCLEIEFLLEDSLVNETIDHCIHQVMEIFYREESGLLLENVHPNGSFSDSFEGRLINPGHAIEATWFMMDLAKRKGDEKLATKAIEICLNSLEYGWDKEFGGIFYFKDIKGYPPQQLEWDQKLWWVHLETLIALLKGYQFNQNPKCLEWFEKVHDYSWDHFRDSEHDEWFGYLNRQGEVLLPLKGGKWKGCFHVPRALWKCWEVLESLH